MSRFILTLTTRGIGFTEQNCVCFLKIRIFPRLFQELLNQYHFKCISHGDAKCGYEILQFRKILQFCLTFCPVVCTRLPHGKHLSGSANTHYYIVIL